MKSKKEFFILILVIAALALYLIFRTTDKTHYQLPEIPEAAKMEITKIEITKPEVSFIMNKQDNDWFIEPGGYLADPDRIKSMLDVVSGLTLSDLVSESKNYLRYDLADDKKINVKAWAKDVLRLEFEVGKTAPSRNHTYIKLPKDPRVFQAGGNFRDTLDVTLEKIRDKTVLTLNPDEIREMALTKGDVTISLVKTQVPVETKPEKSEDEDAAQSGPKMTSLWKTADGDAADQDAIQDLLSSLSDLKCAEYIEDQVKEDLTGPIFTVTLTGVQSHSLSLFKKAKKDDADYPAVSSGSVYPFRISGYKADKIMKAHDEMLEKKSVE